MNTSALALDMVQRSMDIFIHDTDDPDTITIVESLLVLSLVNLLATALAFLGVTRPGVNKRIAVSSAVIVAIVLAMLYFIEFGGFCAGASMWAAVGLGIYLAFFRSGRTEIRYRESARCDGSSSFDNGRKACHRSAMGLPLFPN